MSYLKMGDVSLKAPAVQSVQDMQEAEQSNGHLARDNVSEDCALSMKMGDPSELPSSPIDSQRMEENEARSVKDISQPKAESAQRDASDLNEKTFLYGNANGSTAEYLDGDSSRHWRLVSTNLQEEEEQIVDEVDAREPVIVPQFPSIGEVPKREEHSTQFSDDSSALTHELRVEIKSTKGDGNYFPSKILDESEKIDSAHLQGKRDCFGEETGCLDGTGSSSDETSQTSLSLPVNEGGHEQTRPNNQLIGDPEILPPSTSTGKDEEHVGFQNEMDSFLDPSNQEWSDLDFGETMLISTNIEGWQRFDSEEVNISTNCTQGAGQRGGTWEQLLDDGLDSIQRDAVIQPLQLASPTPYKENNLELPSPGNPFVEELERASSFSKADGFVRGKDLPSTDRLSQVSEELPPLHLNKGLFAEGGHADHSGMATVAEGKENTVKIDPVNAQETKLRLQSSTSLDFMEPFEAPSFMSLVDPKSHALFEACMPTYQANRPMQGHENDGEKWVADFDLVAPSTQEITRSMSLPRPGSDTPGQRPGQSVSFTVNREQETSKKESHSPSVNRAITGFLSPKFSPLVQKVVDKVRSTPAVANGMLNTVRQAMSPKASDKKSTSGSLLTRCMCW